MNRIGPQEKALIHVARAQLGLDEDVYRDILRTEAGKESSIDLTPAEFDRVMKRFRALGFRRKPGKKEVRPRPNPSATITRGLQNKIDALYNELGWTDPKRRTGFNKRMTGHPWPQTRAEANKIIEALKAMSARAKQEAET